jgi:hypothetical protein
MKHFREDYNRIQDPENKIPEDEPVFLLRAQDRFAPGIVREWAKEVRESGNLRLATQAFQCAFKMQLWQLEHGRKNPDAPENEIEDQ